MNGRARVSAGSAFTRFSPLQSSSSRYAQTDESRNSSPVLYRHGNLFLRQRIRDRGHQTGSARRGMQQVPPVLYRGAAHRRQPGTYRAYAPPVQPDLVPPGVPWRLRGLNSALFFRRSPIVQSRERLGRSREPTPMETSETLETDAEAVVLPAWQCHTDAGIMAP